MIYRLDSKKHKSLSKKMKCLSKEMKCFGGKIEANYQF